MKSLKCAFAGDKLKGDLIAQINSGELQPGEAILPERKLAKQYGISYVTVRRAVDALVRQGLLRREPSIGIFVQKWENQKDNGGAIPTAPADLCNQLPSAPHEKVEKPYVLMVSGRSADTYHLCASSILSEELQRRGLVPIPIGVAPGENLYDKWLEAESSRREAMGAIIFGSCPAEETEKIIGNAGLNMVLMGDLDLSKRISLSIDHIAVSQWDKSYLATTCLIRQGHRRIAAAITCALPKFLRQNLAVWSWEIIGGYQQALRDNGIEPCPGWVFGLEHIFSLNDPDCRRNYLEYAKQKHAEWENPQARPTALIHMQYENILNDLLNLYFPGIFVPENMVCLLPEELLKLTYTGLTTTMAVSHSFRSICVEAINCLLYRQKSGAEAPVRHIVVKDGKLWRREHGVWQQAELPPADTAQACPEPGSAAELAAVAG